MNGIERYAQRMFLRLQENLSSELKSMHLPKSENLKFKKFKSTLTYDFGKLL